EETVLILRGLKSRYEQHHDIVYTDTALRAAAELSAKHINDRFLPDKAIDVIDEVGADLRLRHHDQAEPLAVTVPDVERVVARIARIPERTVSASESEKLQHLETTLHERIFGQEEAVRQVVWAVKRSRAGFREPNKPVAQFLFVGPTGVGKTELARQLAESLGVTLQRFDMSEYQEKHTVSRLVGAPPGYVGYEEGGLLTEAVRRHPHCVLLLDEIEKAHPQVHRLFLRLLDTGKATDSTGRELDFSNLTVIATSNVGDWSTDPIGFASTRGVDARVPEAALKRAFPPEFLGRFDAVVPFRPLGRDDCARILSGLVVPRASARLSAERGVSLELDDGLLSAVTERGYDPATGARGLERAFQALVAVPLAAALPACEGPGRLLGRLGPDARATFEFVPEGGLYRGGDAG
ncbi:MAG TPA: AAA family ATPase, partial [Spirochaetales bacterium]|nr:AAA family ATPase [Spirochaetales bacterium]